MRNGQKRMRGRNNNNNNNNHRKSQNPLTRVYESNGPDVKIRGTASHIAEKYIQLARDSQSSGDPVAAENYYQHAEHYFRLIAVAQEQFRQQNPYYNVQPQTGQSGAQGAADDNYDDDGDEGQPFMGQNEPGFAPQPPSAAGAALSAARRAAVSAARSAAAAPPATSAAAATLCAAFGSGRQCRRRGPERIASLHYRRRPAAAKPRPEHQSGLRAER